MKPPKARLTELAGKLSDRGKENIQLSDIGNLPGTDLHPPYGEKADFRKLTVTLSTELYRQVIEEVTRRKVARDPGADLSGVVREALALFFSHRREQ